MKNNYLLKFPPRKSLRIVFLILALAATVGSVATIAKTTKATRSKAKRINTEHLLPINEKFSFTKPTLNSSQKLIPMPSGDIAKASANVKSTRNPFKSVENINLNTIGTLEPGIILSGITKAGDQLAAIITTAEGQNIYMEGDIIGNGFMISDISTENRSVKITNGSYKYELYLEQ